VWRISSLIYGLTLYSRATRVLASKGFYVSLLVYCSICLPTQTVQAFWNWFDPTAWYPLGRVVGGTVYPGLMATSGVIYNILHALNLPVDIRHSLVDLHVSTNFITRVIGGPAVVSQSRQLCQLSEVVPAY
jgi:hypothetical protein